jgi:hypothetical protein
MPQPLVELSKELTLALIEMGYVLHDNVQDTLTALKAQEEAGTFAPVPATDIPVFPLIRGYFTPVGTRRAAFTTPQGGQNNHLH